MANPIKRFFDRKVAGAEKKEMEALASLSDQLKEINPNIAAETLTALQETLRESCQFSLDTLKRCYQETKREILLIGVGGSILEGVAATALISLIASLLAGSFIFWPALLIGGALAGVMLLTAPPIILAKNMHTAHLGVHQHEYRLLTNTNSMKVTYEIQFANTLIQAAETSKTSDTPAARPKRKRRRRRSTSQKLGDHSMFSNPSTANEQTAEHLPSPRM